MLRSCIILGLVLGACDSSDPVSPGADSGSNEGGPGDSATTDHAGTDSLLADGPTDTGAADDGGGSIHCDPAEVSCESAPSPCSIGQVRQVIISCWGDCVPVESCADVPAQPNCDLNAVSCKMVEPNCPTGYVPTAEGSCYGPCVPVGVCACTPGGPASQCPQDYVCHNSAKRCGPLD